MAHSCVVRYQEHTAVNASCTMPNSKTRPDAFGICWYGRRLTSSCWRLYAFTAAFPKQETYGLSLQMRRAAVSIPANIAEGFRRRGKADKARFMNMAEGSIEECRYYLILANDLGYGDTATAHCFLEEVSRLLNAYAAAILSSGS